MERKKTPSVTSRVARTTDDCPSSAAMPLRLIQTFSAQSGRRAAPPDDWPNESNRTRKSKSVFGLGTKPRFGRSVAENLSSVISKNAQGQEQSPIHSPPYRHSSGLAFNLRSNCSSAAGKAYRSSSSTLTHAIAAHANGSGSCPRQTQRKNFRCTVFSG